MLFFLVQPTQTQLYSFHGAVWLQGLLDCSSCRTLEDKELKDGRAVDRMFPACKGPDSSPLRSSSASPRLPSHQPTQGRPAFFPLSSHLSSVSYLHTSLLSADWTTPIHLIFPHKPYLPPFSNHFIWSFQHQKLVTEIQNWSFHSWEKQTTPFLVGRLFSCWGLMFVCFTFQNHAVPASYSTCLLPNYLGTFIPN